MRFPLATVSRLSRQPSLAPFPIGRTLLAVSLLFAFFSGQVFAQTSPDQSWGQNGQSDASAPNLDQSYSQQGYPDTATRQPLAAGQLEQLVAPIALYPDALVAQVLAASTYPSQVADADRWRQAQGYASAEQIASGADMQSWDPSVKALTAFPQVLAQMDRNLQWTTDLGNAYYNQPQDVLEAIQVMRRRAQSAGTLRSTPQEDVGYDDGNIELAPPDPQVVYVPTYNPWAAYGAPIAPYPGFSVLGAIGGFVGDAVLRYGLGIAVSAFTRPWGWLAWGLDWLGHALLFNHADYYSHSRTVADWGFPHHGFYAYRGHEGFGRMARGNPERGAGRGVYGSGWHSFNRGGERHAENFGERSRGFDSFRGDRGSTSDFHSRPIQRAPEGRGEYRSAFNHGAQGFGRGDPYRGQAGTNFARKEFDGRSFDARPYQERPYQGRSMQSRGFEASSAKSHGGFHLFGGGHSHDNFAGGGRSHNEFASNRFSSSHSSFFHGGGGHPPKGFSGGGKSFGGGKSHGGGGHSGGGKHHR